jgi:hypothetical protein
MKLPLTSSDNNAQLASLQRPYSTAQGNTVSTGSTIIATGGNIKSGQAAYDSGSGYWLGNDAGIPRFSIGDSSGDKMTWDGSTLSVTGNLTATTGTIGGWTIGATTITGGNVTLDSTGNIRAGQTAYNTGTGFWLGIDSGTPKFSVGDSSATGLGTTGNLTWNGTSLGLTGFMNIGSAFMTFNNANASASTLFNTHDFRITAEAQAALDTPAMRLILASQGNGTVEASSVQVLFNYNHSSGGAASREGYLNFVGTDETFDFYLGDGSSVPNVFTLHSSGQARVPVTGSSAGILIGGDAQIYRGAADTLRTPDSLTVDGTLTVGTNINPDANDGAALGASALGWSDLFLAEGGVINWDNGDATLTQAGNVVTLAGATLTADVNGTIGATTPAAGSFTTATASGLVDISGAAAGQIKFPASQNSSSDANTLDDYEEGTYTPAPEGTGTAGTPTGTFAGHYIKIGSQVWVSCQLVFTALTGMVGNLIIRNLPFQAISGSSSRAALAVAFRGNFTNDFPIVVRVAENTTDAVPNVADLDNTAVAIADLSATTNLYFSGCYRAAA